MLSFNIDIAAVLLSAKFNLKSNKFQINYGLNICYVPVWEPSRHL